MNKFSLITGILSFFWIILSGVRWMIVYSDTSQAILGMGLGLVGLGGAYMYNWMRNKDKENEDLTDSISLTREWVRHILKLNKLRQE